MFLYHVTGIGDPYDIHVKIDTNIPQQLDRPIPVALHKIDGKHGNKKTLYGGITAVSHERAILETEADLEGYDNLQINAGGRLFCKALEKTGRIICYSILPSPRVMRPGLRRHVLIKETEHPPEIHRKWSGPKYIPDRHKPVFVPGKRFISQIGVVNAKKEEKK